MRKLVEEVTKKEIPSHANAIVFEICCNEIETDEDVEVPYVRYLL
jgi:ubiquitin-activating enzyme E1